MSYLRDCVSAMTGVPQIADDLLQRPSRPSWATTGLMHGSNCGLFDHPSPLADDDEHYVYAIAL